MKLFERLNRNAVTSLCELFNESQALLGYSQRIHGSDAEDALSNATLYVSERVDGLINKNTVNYLKVVCKHESGVEPKTRQEVNLPDFNLLEGKMVENVGFNSVEKMQCKTELLNLLKRDVRFLATKDRRALRSGYSELRLLYGFELMKEVLSELLETEIPDMILKYQAGEA